ncbi:hypothetical protein D3C76_1879140 [compost metagenome]
MVGVIVNFYGAVGAFAAALGQVGEQVILITLTLKGISIAILSMVTLLTVDRPVE